MTCYSKSARNALDISGMETTITGPASRRRPDWIDTSVPLSIGDCSSRRQDPKANPLVTSGTELDRNGTNGQITSQIAW
jgi:hypothetical protein